LQTPQSTAHGVWGQIRAEDAGSALWPFAGRLPGLVLPMQGSYGVHGLGNGCGWGIDDGDGAVRLGPRLSLHAWRRLVGQDHVGLADEFQDTAGQGMKMPLDCRMEDRGPQGSGRRSVHAIGQALGHVRQAGIEGAAQPEHGSHIHRRVGD